MQHSVKAVGEFMDDKAQIMFACYIKEIKTQEKNPSHS
jgi:hypothetical protein